ncbi:retrotransposon protein, putative, ty1-copia subclass [Tanacetum coccineum]
MFKDHHRSAFVNALFSVAFLQLYDHHIARCKYQVRLYNSFERCTLGNRRRICFKGNVSKHSTMTNTQTPPPATTVVIPTGAPTTNTVANHAERPEKFNVNHPPKVYPLMHKLASLKHGNIQIFMPQLFLNGLNRILIDNGTARPPAKELLESLNAKQNKDAHKRKEMNVEDLVVRLRIEEDNKLAQKDTYAPDSTKLQLDNLKSGIRHEFTAPFAELCAKHGIRHEFTAPYSPQQNGIAESKNRTLKEMVTAMLISSGMSKDIWGEAILTATYLLNKIPRKDKEETPYELWMGRKPSYQYLLVWGCLAKPSYQYLLVWGCLAKETRSSSRLDDEVVQNRRQRDDNGLQDER